MDDPTQSSNTTAPAASWNQAIATLAAAYPQFEESLLAYKTIIGIIPQLLSQSLALKREETALADRRRITDWMTKAVSSLLTHYAEQIRDAITDQTGTIDDLFPSLLSTTPDNPTPTNPLSSSSDPSSSPTSPSTNAMAAIENLRQSMLRQIDAERTKILDGISHDLPINASLPAQQPAAATTIAAPAAPTVPSPADPAAITQANKNN